MAPKVTVTPSTFEFVNFDSDAIAQIASEVAAAVDLPGDAVVTITVDEAEMMGRSKTTVAGNEVTVDVSGGGFESLRKARDFAPERCRAVLGQALMRARDRLDPAFGEPPADDEVPVRLEAAWSTYIEGRLERKGVLPGRPQRRIYHFRVRHGFNDAVDAVFERLWNADGLTWADIEAASSDAAGEPVTA